MAQRRSFTWGDDTDAFVDAAARKEGVPMIQFIREAALARAMMSHLATRPAADPRAHRMIADLAGRTAALEIRVERIERELRLDTDED